MKNAIIRKRGTLVIPAAMRHRYGMEEGCAVEIEETGGGLMIRAAPRPQPSTDEATFWEEFERDARALRQDPVAWDEFQQEFASTEVNDGLESEPPYPL